MRHWWVNQNQTYKQETEGGYMWSPKTRSDGGRNKFYDFMTETQPGDVVFSFSSGLIQAVGVVTGAAQTAPKPTEFGTTGENWDNVGWYVPTRFTQLARPIRPKDHMQRLRPLLPPKYSPLQANGNGLQNLYLTALSPALAAEITALLGNQVARIVGASVIDDEAAADTAQERIESDHNIPETERQQLIRARKGQGIFRSGVETLEHFCRVTGTTDRGHQRASHIKPWAVSDNTERLDPANGLMLAPHIDHLFDRGFITFQDDGRLEISTSLQPEVIGQWCIAQTVPPAPLSARQAEFMSYHRQHVFRR